MTPSIGHIVEYRSKTGSYSVPAIVNCTVESIDLEGVRLGHVPDLTGRNNVHLTVFTPGKQGTNRGALGMPTTVNMGGSYQEFDIPYDDNAGPGTWRWLRQGA